jgi:hypothetical protein
VNATPRIAALALAALVGVGCGSGRPPYPPDYLVDVGEGQYGTFTLEVYDQDRLVVDARPSAYVQGAATSDWQVVARPETREIELSFTGGGCGYRPVLHVRGEPGAVELQLIPVPRELRLPVVECPPQDELFGATLVMAEPVAEEQLTIQVIR